MLFCLSLGDVYDTNDSEQSTSSFQNMTYHSLLHYYLLLSIFTVRPPCAALDFALNQGGEKTEVNSIWRLERQFLYLTSWLKYSFLSSFPTEMFMFVVFHVIILFVFLSGCSESSRNETTNNSCCNNSLTSDLGRRIKTECACFLKLFANATQRFNLCLVKHAKPLRMCEKCALQYSEVVARNPCEIQQQ